VRDAIDRLRGWVDLQLEPQLPIEQVQIRFDRQAAAVLGLNVQQLSEALEIALKTAGGLKGIGDGRFPCPLMCSVTVKAGATRTTSTAIRSPSNRYSFRKSQFPNRQHCPGRQRPGGQHRERGRIVLQGLIVVSSNVSGRPLWPVVKTFRR